MRSARVPKAAVLAAQNFIAFAKEIVVAMESAVHPRNGSFFLAPPLSVLGTTKSVLALYTIVNLVWQIAAVDAATEAHARTPLS